MSFKNKRKHRFGNFGGFEKLDLQKEAGFLIESGLFGEALVLLKGATQKYPSDAALWKMLADVSSRRRDILTMRQAFGKLIKLRPDDPNWWYGLAYTDGIDGRIALSYRRYREFVGRFPDDERVLDALEIQRLAEVEMRQTLAGFDCPAGEVGFELLSLHDESQCLMQEQRFEEVRELTQKLIDKMPNFLPAYNNLSLVLFVEGETENAILTARRALDKNPDNIHALSNMARFLVFAGRPEEAAECSRRLLPIESNDPDSWTKKIEAFTYVGDDSSVVDLFNQAKDLGRSVEFNTLCRHLAAFAFYRLGDVKAARKLWQKIFKDEPEYEYARDNLNELDLPENERNIFALPLVYWIPGAIMADLKNEMLGVKDGKLFGKDIQTKLSRFLEKNPNFLKLFPKLLDRSDRTAREFVIRLLKWAGTPETYAVLEDFAFGQTASDDLRNKAAMALLEAGVISSDVRLWKGGEWCELRLMTYIVTGEPVATYPLKPKAQKLLEKGYLATQKQNLDLAFQYYRMALDANGEDHPSILYNVLAVEQVLDTSIDSERKLEDIVDRFPDYTFAAIMLASINLRKGNTKKAKDLTERFLDKKTWHITEIRQWLHFSMELSITQKQFESARMSLEAMRNFDKDFDFDHWSKVILAAELIEREGEGKRKSKGRRKA